MKFKKGDRVQAEMNIGDFVHAGDVFDVSMVDDEGRIVEVHNNNVFSRMNEVHAQCFHIYREKVDNIDTYAAVVEWLYLNDGRFPSTKHWRTAFLEFLKETL